MKATLATGDSFEATDSYWDIMPESVITHADGTELIQCVSDMTGVYVPQEEKPKVLPPWKGNDYKTRGTK